MLMTTTECDGLTRRRDSRRAYCSLQKTSLQLALDDASGTGGETSGTSLIVMRPSSDNSVSAIFESLKYCFTFVEDGMSSDILLA